jgi:cytochrome P450
MEPRATGTRDTAGACDGFDDKKLEAFSLLAAVVSWLSSYAVFRWYLPVMRFITPVVCVPFVGRVVIRYDQVREVLSKDNDFPVPWGEKMVQVTGGPNAGGKNFVLGMPRDDEYRLSYEQLAEAFPLADVAKHVSPLSRDAAERILAFERGVEQLTFDAVEKLVTAVPTELCESYYGIQIPDKVAFARWTLPVSSYLFGPPFGTPANAPPADAKLMNAAAACLRKTIRDSIQRAKRVGAAKPGIVLPRLLEMQSRDRRLSDDVIHAQLFGMVLGFIPTNVLAGGNILETLLLRPEFRVRARAAALAGDDDLLWRCLREALRFRNINLGPWRTCRNGYTIPVGRFREVRIPPDARVLASTQAAMFDPRRIERPHAFDPDRRDEDYLVFSVGQHWCLGAYIAIAQITQTLKPLLKGALERAEGRRGRMKRYNVFPLHLHVKIKQGS